MMLVSLPCLAQHPGEHEVPLESTRTPSLLLDALVVCPGHEKAHEHAYHQGTKQNSHHSALYR